ncbi:MarR family winged helix-turn-helix transcriptional regulator [Paenibacillus marinisediminis]
MSNYKPHIDRYIAAHFTVTKSISLIIEQLHPKDITSEQFQVLNILHERKSCTSTELAAVFLVGKSSITAIINRLVDRGLVLRTPNPHDRRQIDLSLTTAGLDLFQQVEAQLVDMISKWLVHFEQEEIESFISNYEKLAHIISKGSV